MAQTDAHKLVFHGHLAVNTNGTMADTGWDDRGSYSRRSESKPSPAEFRKREDNLQTNRDESDLAVTKVSVAFVSLPFPLATERSGTS
jgi:hypothetical protein